MLRPLKMIAICALVATLGACQKNNNNDYTAYALTGTGSIITFQASDPGSISNTVAVSGLSAGETLVQIAYNAGDSTLYGITSSNVLCTVNGSTGAVTPVTGAAFTTTTMTEPVISFDPVADQLRLISTAYNLRIALDGTLADDGTQVAFDSSDSNSGKTPRLAAITYANPVSGAGSTTLYALDVTTQSLLRVGNASVGNTSSVDNGDLHTIGGVGVQFTSNAGFSIEADDGTAYAVLQQSGAGAALYTIDLGTGAATKLGSIGSGNQTLIGLAMLP